MVERESLTYKLQFVIIRAINRLSGHQYWTFDVQSVLCTGLTGLHIREERCWILKPDTRYLKPILEVYH